VVWIWKPIGFWWQIGCWYFRSSAISVKGKEIETLAAQRCPGVFCMANTIPFETRLEHEGGFD